MESLYHESVLKSVEEHLPESVPRSTCLFFSRSAGNFGDHIPSDNDVEDHILPDIAVSEIFSYLPIKDVFRFGFKLSKSWFELWKKNPLVLHDAQLLPDLVKEQIIERNLFRYNISTKITHILDMHPGPIHYMRLEYTTWRGGNAQLRVWIEKLINKGVIELILFGRWPRRELDVLPNNIMHLCQLKKLTLCFFKIPELSVGHAISFTGLRVLVVVHCELREVDITILLIKCGKLNRISLGHINSDCFTISSASLEAIHLWHCRTDTVFILDCPELVSFVQLLEQGSRQDAQIFVSASPLVRMISHLYLDQQTLYIDDCQIMIGMIDHPQYEALKSLSLGVRFVGNFVLDVIRELLLCFPNLIDLTITRLDPSEHHTTAFIKWRALLRGITCVQDTLEKFCLFHSGLDDCEIDLAASMLLYAAHLKVFVVLASVYASDGSVQKLETVINDIHPASDSIIKLHLGVEPLTCDT